MKQSQIIQYTYVTYVPQNVLTATVLWDMNNCSYTEKSSMTEVPYYIFHIHLYTKNNSVTYNV